MGKFTKSRIHNQLTRLLPLKVQNDVDQMLTEGKTYREIKEYLDGAGYNINASAIGRYGKRFTESYQSALIAREQARLIVAQGGDGLIIGEATLLMSLRQKYDDLMSGKIERADMSRFDADVAKLVTAYVLIVRLKKDVERTADKAAEAAKSDGVSPETITKIRREILMMAV